MDSISSIITNIRNNPLANTIDSHFSVWRKSQFSQRIPEFICSCCYYYGSFTNKLHFFIQAINQFTHTSTLSWQPTTESGNLTEKKGIRQTTRTDGTVATSSSRSHYHIPLQDLVCLSRPCLTLSIFPLPLTTVLIHIHLYSDRGKTPEINSPQ